jgi:hypothetical protein
MRPRLLLAALIAAATLAACDDAALPADEPSGGLFDGAPPLADAGLAGPPPGMWSWISDPGMRCRDSTETGFGLRTAAGSDEFLIVFEASGACFNAETCASSRAHFDSTTFADFAATLGREGLFDRRPQNPFRGWNMIYVPHCTGDVCTGDTTDVAIEGVPGLQQFVGQRNVRAMLARLAPIVQNASAVVVTGAGFAATATYGLIAEQLAPAPVHLFADAGPMPPNDDVLTPELQARLRSTWNGEALIPPGCADCSQPNGDGFEHILPYYASTNPDRVFGLIAYSKDPTNRWFFGFDNPNCIFSGGACRVPVRDYQIGLINIRRLLEPYPNAGTYYISGNGHTSLDDDDKYFGTAVNGVQLTQWIRNALDGTVGHIPQGQFRDAGTFEDEEFGAE